jgi:hypothetical protein
MQPKMTRSWFCNFVFAVVACFLFAVLFPNRPSKFEYDLLDQHVMDINLPLYRHRDPLRMRVDRGHIPDLLELGPVTEAFDKNEVRAFVDDHILPSYDNPSQADAAVFFATLQTRMLTPLHATMMFMGCYGYIYDDGYHAVEGVKSTQDYLKDNAIWKDYTTPFLLQALETRNAIAITHDRSACSCMKDFASPTLVKLNDNEQALDKKTSDKLLDTCSVQNTIDYALAGASAEVLSGKNPIDLKKSVMLEPMAVGDLSRRQRKDPLRKLLEDARVGAIDATVVDGDLKKFVAQYCSLVQGLNSCPASWTTPNTLTNAQFFVELLARVDSVKPHNKLRPPKLCTDNPKQCAADQHHETFSNVSYATYAAYVEKYRHAFHMCSRAGVPQYTTLRLGSMKTPRVYNVGQCFLFLAGLFAFMWSFMVAHYINKSKSDSWTTDEKLIEQLGWENSEYRWCLMGGTLAVVVSWVWLLIALVSGWYWYGAHDYDKEQKNQLVHETDGASSFFFLFFWAVFASFMLVCGFLYWKFFEMSYTRLETVYGDAKKAYSNVKKAFHSDGEPFARIIERTQPTKDLLYKYDAQITRHLQSMAPYAQVALDLTVIAALTVLAVACVAQRGVQDINVISAVSVLFLTIGLLAHLSNMLRLVHVYLQWDPKAHYNQHVQKAAHHRLYLSLLLALMLFVFTVLGGLDSGSTISSHTMVHQIVFALVALFVLCGTDVIEHVAGAFEERRVDANFSDTTERFWLQLSTKNYYLAWICVIALLLLHVHRAMGICEAAKGTFSTTDCLLLSKY